MTVTEVLGGLGSWELRLIEATPQSVVDQLGFFGHVAIVSGSPDVEATGDALLAGARYVGVLRGKGKGDSRRIAGNGMVVWIGDQDGKGHVIETPINLTSATLLQAVTALLPPSVQIGTVHPQVNPAARYTGTHTLQDRRKALTTVCDAFGVEFRVNGNGKVDVGTQAQLYQPVPRTDGRAAPIIRRVPGSDIDIRAIEGDLSTEERVDDYSTDVVLVGQTVGSGDTPEAVFAIGRKAAASVPYVDLFGQPVKFTRLISESGETTGSVDQRSTLHLNRFSRVVRALTMRAEEYDSEGSFAVGDMAYVYDPETGIVDRNRELDFRGERIWPDIIRVSGMTWPVTRGHTVGFRTGAGVWLDLTPYVTWETGGGELTVGDLPRSLTRAGDDPLALRVDAARGQAAPSVDPGAPTVLEVTTYAFRDGKGVDRSRLRGSWTAPTANVDGSVPVDVAYYSVRYRAVGQGVWESVFTPDDEADIEVVLDTDYEVAVAAVNKAGRIGAYTATVSVRSAADTIAPPAPADALVTSRPLLMRIEYVGTDALGAAMPKDTRQIDMHVGTTAGFAPTTATRVNSVTPFARGVFYVDVPYGQTRYVKLVAVDHSGNPSTPSAAVAGSSTQAADGDIGSLSLSKLVSGIGTFDLVNAGRITTALTGARRELNAIGFQAFDATEALTVSLDGISNLLTGVLKTALTGRRIEIAAAGDKGEVNFYNPSNVRSAIRGYTSRLTGTVGVEAIQIGVPITGAASSWNAINVGSSEEIWMVSGFVGCVVGGDSTYDGFFVDYSTDRGDPTTGVYARSRRMLIDRTETTMVDGRHVAEYSLSNGRHAFFAGESINLGSDPDRRNKGRIIIDGHNEANGSPLLQFAVGSLTALPGVSIKYYRNADFTDQRLEIRNGADSAFNNIRALAFQVSSDEIGKRSIRDYGAGAMDRVRETRVRRYKHLKDESPSPREHIGLVAQEAPAEVVLDDGETPLAIDLYGVAVLGIAGLQETDKRIDKVEERLARLEKRAA